MKLNKLMDYQTWFAFFQYKLCVFETMVGVYNFLARKLEKKVRICRLFNSFHLGMEVVTNGKEKIGLASEALGRLGTLGKIWEELEKE